MSLLNIIYLKIFTRADKENSCLTKKNDYVNRIEIMLSDDNTYIIINKDPLCKLTDIRALLMEKREIYRYEHL